MKVQLKIFLLFSCANALHVMTIQKSLETSKVIIQVINHFYRKNGIEFDIMSYGKDVKMFDQLITQLIRNITDSPHQVYRKNRINGEFLKLNQSSILLFDSLKYLEAFMEWHRRHRFNNNPTWKPLHLLVYCFKATETQLKNLKFNVLLQFQSFLLEQDNRTARLMGITRFSPENCDKTNVVDINTFSKKSMSWTRNEFFLKPQGNFQRCDIVFVVPFAPPHSSYSKVIGSNEYTYNGTSVNLITALSEKLNFAAVFIASDGS